jgi:hypothetical protein
LWWAGEVVPVVTCVAILKAEAVQAGRALVSEARMLPAQALVMVEPAVRKPMAVWVETAVAVLPETDNPESLAS